MPGLPGDPPGGWLPAFEHFNALLTERTEEIGELVQNLRKLLQVIDNASEQEQLDLEKLMRAQSLRSDRETWCVYSLADAIIHGSVMPATMQDLIQLLRDLRPTQ